MSNTYISCYIHYIFSTKGREPWITKDIRNKLFPYIGGVARRHGMKSLQVGGTEDHIHHLIALPGTISIAKAVQLLKGNSSKWIHDTFPEHRHFYWQSGYGAFSVNISLVNTTIAYIKNQQQHHRSTSFTEEFTQILNKHKTLEIPLP